MVFVGVGSLGLLIHLSILGTFHLFDAPAFALGQVVATLAAMMFNFFLNNLVTFRDRRLRGLALLRGMVIFCAACSMGVLINLSFAWISRPELPDSVLGEASGHQLRDCGQIDAASAAAKLSVGAGTAGNWLQSS